MSNEMNPSVAIQSQQDDAAEYPAEQSLEAVSLDEFLDEGEPVENQSAQDDAAAQDEASPAEPDPSGQGDPDNANNADNPNDPQKDINKALGQRLHAEREKLQRQFMQQYGEDLKLAQLAKKVLGEDPQSLLLRSEAMAYAKAHHIPENAALEIIRKNHGLTPEQAPRSRDAQGRFVKPSANPNIDNLVSQAQTIQNRDGVNMIEVLKTDPYLRERLQKDGWDINQAYGYHLAKRASPERAPTPSAVRGGTRPGVARSISKMTDKEFHRMDDALGGGAIIKL